MLPLVGGNVDNSHYIDDDDGEGNECLVVQLWPLEQMKTSLTPFHHSCACDHDDADDDDNNARKMMVRM